MRLLLTVMLSAVVLFFASFNKKPVTWVAIGDSITYLNDHQDETGNRITRGYMTMVAEKLPHVSFINQGHNGWTAGDIAREIGTLGLSKADVYSIFLGTNDWWQGRRIGSLSDYTNNTGNKTLYGSFRVIIDKLKQLNPVAKIILITPMQRTDFVYINDFKNNAYGSYKEKNGQTLAGFSDAISQIGKYENFDVIDLYHHRKLSIEKLVKFKRLKDPETGVYKNYPYPAYMDIPFQPDSDEYPYPPASVAMTYDGLHPSDKAYSIIAKALVAKMKKRN